MGVGSNAATTPIPAFPLKGKVFLCLHKIPFWGITLNRTHRNAGGTEMRFIHAQLWQGMKICKLSTTTGCDSN